MSSNDFLPQTTLVLDVGKNLDFLLAKLNQVNLGNKPSFGQILLASPPGQKTKIFAKLPESFKHLEIAEIQSLRLDLFPFLHKPYLAYLPSDAPYSPPQMDFGADLEKHPLFIQPWVPFLKTSDSEWARGVYLSLGWISTPKLLQKMDLINGFSLRDLERSIRNAHTEIPYFSASASESLNGKPPVPQGQPTLTKASRVLALVPHFNCEEWLEQCLYSLVHQTRLPENIVVMDDCSTHSPLEIVKKFPSVALFRSPENVGPYRLLQSMIDQTQFDGYMFQDSDDWSSLDRLELLLREAETGCADWVGSQEIVYFSDAIHTLRYPLILKDSPQSLMRYPFCYSSSLISRSFFKHLGGFASGLRFSGDFEFFSRAIFAGKVINLDRYCYHRRVRKDSLITSEETGLASHSRKEVDSQIEVKKAANHVLRSKGFAPLLEPIKTAPPIRFQHLTGPQLI